MAFTVYQVLVAAGIIVFVLYINYKEDVDEAFKQLWNY
jgi:hypothetical protein